MVKSENWVVKEKPKNSYFMQLQQRKLFWFTPSGNESKL